MIFTILHGKSIYFFEEKKYNRKYENRRIKTGYKNIKEPRKTGHGNFRHKLEDIIIIGLCTVICGGEDFADMEAFGKSRQEYLGKFLELPNGIPDSDTFRRVFEKLDPSELSSCLIDWVSAERAERGVVAMDGKTICGSGNAKHRAYHVISAFAAENQLHWCLDVIFREDASRARKDNSPLNLNALRKTALILVSQAQYKRISKKRLMFRAALEPALFLDILLDPSSVSPQ